MSSKEQDRGVATGPIPESYSLGCNEVWGGNPQGSPHGHPFRSGGLGLFVSPQEQ